MPRGKIHVRRMESSGLISSTMGTSVLTPFSVISSISGQRSMLVGRPV